MYTILIPSLRNRTYTILKTGNAEAVMTIQDATRKCTNSVSFQDAIDVEDIQIPPRTRALTNAEQEDFEASELTLDHPPSSTTARLASNEESIKEPVINTDSSTSQQNATKDMKSVGPMDFEMLCIIGLGAFGKVVQVRHKQTGEILAMKIVSNNVIVKKNSVAYLQAERDIMTKINHPFLVSLRYAFQTASSVYLVMPFVAGGELFHHLSKQGLLLEDTAIFYAAEIVLALEHLHSQGIIHRDLKPENVLVDDDGHIRLTDFGLAKEMANEEDSTKTMCGTNGRSIVLLQAKSHKCVEYMAPEMIRGRSYNKAVDFWALGALIYEMVTGYPPFVHKNKKKLHQKILNEKLSLPKWLRSETHSIIKQLLDRNVDKRLGSGKSNMFQVKGVQAIKNHAFFRSVDWQKLARKQLTPPIKPNLQSSCDTVNFSEEFTTLAVDRMSRLDTCADDKKLFARFSFCAEEYRTFAQVVAEPS
ncbi:unnamed protein product [Albugo candida]|uniref:Protein kinase domain-containing protein n=1 Tax=Albugo candida TaxID=65357 RepID=A0A024GAX2_9STRA|nr:unnamed protein product [Albugo candida]|eukprot:CCI43883.1 unnamed protein product [Albugo candida]